MFVSFNEVISAATDISLVLFNDRDLSVAAAGKTELGSPNSVQTTELARVAALRLRLSQLQTTMRLLSSSVLVLSGLVVASKMDQTPIGSSDSTYVPERQDKPTLADLLTIQNSASIFYSYARELELSKGLSDKDVKITLFVPTNKAVMSLNRKP